MPGVAEIGVHSRAWNTVVIESRPFSTSKEPDEDAEEVMKMMRALQERMDEAEVVTDKMIVALLEHDDEAFELGYKRLLVSLEFPHQDIVALTESKLEHRDRRDLNNMLHKHLEDLK